MNHIPSSTDGHHRWRRSGVGIVCLAATLSLTLSGCGSSAKPITKPITEAAAVIPDDIKTTKELLEVAVLDSMARPNPFQSLVAPKELPVEPPPETMDPGTGIGTGTPVEPEAKPLANPFEGFMLSGIIYRGSNKSMAILATPDGKTKIVRPGDVVQGGEEGAPLQLQVARIDKTALLMKVMNPPDLLPGEFRSNKFKLTSLIGQSKSGGGTAAGGNGKQKSNVVGSQAADASAGEASAESADAPPKEIEDLMNGNSGAADPATPTGPSQGRAGKRS